MYRTELIEFSTLPSLSTRRPTAKPKEETRIEHNGFTLVEKRKKIELVINTPNAIYGEDFISKLAGLIQNNGEVKVNCGKDSKQAEFLASELCADDLHDRIFNQDYKEFTCGLRREIVRNGWLDFRGKEYLNVIFKKAETLKNNNEPNFSWLTSLANQSCAVVNPYALSSIDDVDINELPFAEPVEPGEDGASHEIALQGYGPWYEELDQTINLLSQSKPVNIKRESLFSPENSFVLQVRNSNSANTVLIDTSSCGDIQCNEILPQMINCFLENNYVVEIDLGVQDPNREEENQIDGFIRDSREFIPSHVTQSIEEREILPGIKHTFLVFKSY